MHNTAFGSEIVSVVIGRNNLIASGGVGIFKKGINLQRIQWPLLTSEKEKSSYGFLYSMCISCSFPLRWFALIFFFFSFICIKHGLLEKTSQQALYMFIKDFAVIFLVNLMGFFPIFAFPIISVPEKQFIFKHSCTQPSRTRPVSQPSTAVKAKSHLYLTA